jgi:CubicO group peptidase (beta-lactamase class C family)
LDNFDRRLQTLVARHVSPSLAVVAVQGSNLLLARGYGQSDLARGMAASAKTIYLYCSMTKLFTATAVMQLRERGLLELDQAVRAYVPEFPLRHPSGREITVRHLLSHSSGIANPIPISWVHPAENPAVDLDDLTRRLLSRHPRLAFEPGARYAYSNLGYLVLGQVVQHLSGQRYPDYVRQHILDVLAMRHTGFSSADVGDLDVATGYIRTWSLLGIVGRFLVDRQLFGAAHAGYTAFRPFLIDGAPYGGLLGPVSELGSFVQACLGGGNYQGHRVLASASLAEMLTPQIELRGNLLSTSRRTRDAYMGLGWHLAGDGETRSGYHLGGGAGFRSELRIYPELGYGMAVMGNETDYDTGAITREIVAAPRPASGAEQIGAARPV